MILNESPKDVLGRPLAEGDGVILSMGGPTLFRVVQIETSSGLDPSMPQGIMRVHLLATASYLLKAGAKHKELVRVGTLEDLGPLPYDVSSIEPRVK